MSPRVLRAATRGSPLARWQTAHVAALLGVEVEPVIVQTSGDKTQAANVPIEQMRGQGVFVKEVQSAVLDGRADFAVHSAKDLASEPEPGLVIAAVPERGDARDALVGTALEDLPSGAVIATGSVRRRAQLAAYRPDLLFENLRGNIDTRLEKSKRYDAIVMAYTSLQRLEKTDINAHVLDPSVMLPQVSQGALAVECRADDSELIAQLAAIEHAPSRRAIDAERAYLATLGGGCDLPTGAYATIDSDGRLDMTVLLSTLDGRRVLRCHGVGDDPQELGRRLAGEILDDSGGRELLADYRRRP
jgi:hydroxymethylbilane synthase